jgi:hypothetical protein
MMSSRTSALAAVAQSAGEGRTSQPLAFLDAAIHSPRLVQAVCWLLVLFL